MATRKLKPSFCCPYCTLFKPRLVGLVLKACLCAYSIVPEICWRFPCVQEGTGGSGPNRPFCDYIPIKGILGFLIKL